MTEYKPSVPLLSHQVCDAFASAYENTDTTREERERLFWEWLNAEKAKAWHEGALDGFAYSGEGWNGEYMSGIGKPDTCDIERGNASVWHNPYERKA